MAGDATVGRAPDGSALSLHAPPPAASDSVDAKAKLSGVRARIAELTARLGRDLTQRDAQSARLREAELKVTASRQKLDALRTAQQAATRQLAALRVEQLHDERALDATRAELGAQVRAAYMMGGQEEIKMLLNQGNPASAGRMLAYYGYFARQRNAQLEDIRARVRHAADIIAEIATSTANLQALVSEAQRETQSLEGARRDRAQSIIALADRLNGGTQELERLRHQEQALQTLVEDLTRVMQELPADSQQPFAELKGKLAWPVAGHLAAHFQETRASSTEAGVRWNGIMIETARGAKVRTPYFGRVVYADWLQGVGLLMIIGHSGGYMTLYGHAEVLYKSVGDWVSPGDAIAGMGETGAAAPQLYFEIREGRKPVDPKNWLKAAQ